MTNVATDTNVAIETPAASTALADNCFYANYDEVIDGFPLVEKSKGFFVQVGQHGRFKVFPEAMTSEGLRSATVWPRKEGGWEFGVRQSSDASNYLVVDCGHPHAAPHALQGVHPLSDDVVVLGSGREGQDMRFVLRMPVGSKVAVHTADGTLHGLESTEGDITPFEIAPEDAATIVAGLKKSEALRLMSVAGTGAGQQGARQAGYHRGIDEQAKGGDVELFTALMKGLRSGDFGPAVQKRFDAAIKPHLGTFAEQYGLITSRSGSQFIWKCAGYSFTSYVPVAKAPVKPNDAATRKAERQERDRQRTNATKTAPGAKPK